MINHVNIIINILIALLNVAVMEGKIMETNTGVDLEKDVFELITELIQKNNFLLSEPNIKIFRQKKYYSKVRESYIKCDVSIEKYLVDPKQNKNISPSIKIIIECKDYTGAISVDDVEEFHAKLQQIGADNTKGMMITRKGYFQKSAINYAMNNGISLARILPKEQIQYILYYMRPIDYKNMQRKSIIAALTEKDYISTSSGFFSSSGEESLEDFICHALQKR